MSIFRPKLQKTTDRPSRIQNTEEENRKEKKSTEYRRKIQNTEEEYRTLKKNTEYRRAPSDCPTTLTRPRNFYMWKLIS